LGKSAINPAVIAAHSAEIANLKSDLGVVEDTNTATHTIASGQYVIWKGALYTAKSAIPSGTALSSSNLQAAPNGGLNEIISSLYYKAGDVISGYFECYGFITSGGKDVNFFIPLPKSTKNISGCNFSKLKIALRIPSGGYIESNWYDVLSDSNYTVNNVASSNGGAILLINLSKNTTISNVTNNTPIVGRTDITGTFT
jgi:hypothetical protein